MESAGLTYHRMSNNKRYSSWHSAICLSYLDILFGRGFVCVSVYVVNDRGRA